jgi:hypothetical protein
VRLCVTDLVKKGVFFPLSLFTDFISLLKTFDTKFSKEFFRRPLLAGCNKDCSFLLGYQTRERDACSEAS